MNNTAKFEDRASSSRSKHEGESSHHLCDRLSRTRDFSQRQLPTGQDYAVSTREYQTDQSSLKPAPTAARPVLERQQKQRQRQKQPHRFAGVDRVTPYQGGAIMGGNIIALKEKIKGMPKCEKSTCKNPAFMVRVTDRIFQHEQTDDPIQLCEEHF